MKFVILDAHPHNKHDFSSSKYHYLDDLLENTFITDYFLDRSNSVIRSVSPQSKP